MRGSAGPVTEISVFATGISVTGLKISLYEHTREFVQVTELARAESHLGKTEQPGSCNQPG